MENYEYDLIISLGDACFVNGALCKCDLQKITEKFPFDETRGIMWDKCGRGGLAGNVNLICNGFRNFLNLKPLEKRGIDSATNKLWVVNKETGISFRHDFSIGVPIEDEYPKVLERYKGRIADLYRRINQSNRVLFLYMTQIDGFPDTYLIEQQQKLQARFPKQRVEMLYIMQKPGLAPTEYTEKKLSERVTRIDMDVKYTSKTDSVSIIVGNIDLYCQILSRLNVTNKSDIILHNTVARLKWDIAGLSRSAHQRLSRLETRVTKIENNSGTILKQSELLLESRMTQLERTCSDNLKLYEKEEERQLLFAASNIGYLRFKMFHLLIKKWVHIGKKRRDYDIKYIKTKNLLVNAKKLIKKISKENQL